jgi:hypothetical protein
MNGMCKQQQAHATVTVAAVQRLDRASMCSCLQTVEVHPTEPSTIPGTSKPTAHVSMKMRSVSCSNCNEDPLQSTADWLYDTSKQHLKAQHTE